MNKTVLIGLWIISILIFVPTNDFIYAAQREPSQPFEEFLSEVGYKTVESA